jgi:hypothetical protein
MRFDGNVHYVVIELANTKMRIRETGTFSFAVDTASFSALQKIFGDFKNA